MTTSLALAAPGAPVVDSTARTITGLAVPFGPVGQTSAGRLQFARGDLSWSDARRVKLLREHDQLQSVGYATQLDERDDGLHATFHVPPGAAGDAALAEASHGLRDALSVGVQLDDATAERLRRATGGAPVRGVGQLREVSLVSVPAFDDARVGAVAARAELVVSSWSPSTPTTPTPTPEGATVTAPAQPAPQPAQPAQPAAPAQPAPTPAPTDPAAPTQPAQPTTQPVAPSAPPVAVAGGAVVTGAPATYTFAGDGHSLALDAYAARFHGDPEAAQRLHRYNAELTDGNPASVMALAAVLTTDDTPAQPFVDTPVVRRDLIRAQVDRGRPLNSRVSAAGGSVPIRNATPFLIPGLAVEFDGVADHVEGTAHVPEGTLTVDGERTLAPRAVSGAFRVSREMVDSSNPAIDRVALAAMLKDYRRQTESRLAAALRAGLTPVGGITTVSGLRAELIAFGNDDVVAAAVLAGRGFFQALALDEDGNGRPLLPFVNPSNSSGTIRAGYTGASVDGVEVAKATAMPTEEALILDPSTVLVAESPTATFRFDEVEGPGVVKLALFGYYGAALLDSEGVALLQTTPVGP